MGFERWQESGEWNEEVCDWKGDGASFEAIEYAESTREHREQGELDDHSADSIDGCNETDLEVVQAEPTCKLQWVVACEYGDGCGIDARFERPKKALRIISKRLTY